MYITGRMTAEVRKHLRSIPVKETAPNEIILRENNGKTPFVCVERNRFGVHTHDANPIFKQAFVDYEVPDFQKDLVRIHTENLYTSTQFVSITEAIIQDHSLLESLGNGLLTVGNFFTLNTNPDKGKIPTVTYSPLVKLARSLRPHQPNKTSTITMTSLFRTAFNASDVKMKDKDIEDIANGIKKYFMESDIVITEHTGDDLVAQYHESRHSFLDDIGDLYKSCMRYDKCIPWLQLYADNPDKVRMIVARMGNRGIIGRTLVWKLDDGREYADRIYGSAATRQVIYEYCESKGIKNRDWLISAYPCIVSLNPIQYKTFPYLDTMCWYDGANHKLYNKATYQEFELQGKFGDNYLKLLQSPDGDWRVE